jgi:hypothetical protein
LGVPGEVIEHEMSGKATRFPSSRFLLFKNFLLLDKFSHPARH